MRSVGVRRRSVLAQKRSGSAGADAPEPTKRSRVVPKSFPEKTPAARAASTRSPIRIFRPRNTDPEPLFGVPIQKPKQTGSSRDTSQKSVESLADMARKAIP